jgi:hypothetical protein
VSLDRAMVRRCLREDFGMQYQHLKYVPHTLSAVQKVIGAELAGHMLQILLLHDASNFHFLFAGDESWISDSS